MDPETSRNALFTTFVVMSEDCQALRPVEKMCCKHMVGLSTEQEKLKSPL